MKLQCAWCANSFNRPHDIGPIPKYCRASCRQRAYDERKIQAEVERRMRALKRKDGKR